jgi:hypothetical protein
MQQERGLPTARRQRYDEVLAVPPWWTELVAGQCSVQLRPGHAAQYAGIEDVDPTDPATDGVVGEDPPEAFDIGQFGHGLAVPGCGPLHAWR